MKRITATSLAVALAATTAAFAECDDGEMVIKFSHVTNTVNHPKGIAAKVLMDRVNSEMDGVACMKVYPDSVLYNDDQVLEALLQFDVQLAAPSLSKLERFTKKYRIFDLPFIFRDVDAVDRFQSSEFGRDLLDTMQDRGLQGLAFWHNGMKQMSANRPLLEPSDAEGLRFRVQQSDLLAAQMRALKALPVKMPLSDVYEALKNGVVDGQENTYSNILGRRLHTVQDSITETNHGVIDYLVVTSTAWLNSLAPGVRDQFLKILRDVTVASNADATGVNAGAKRAIIAEGGIIHTITDGQRDAWIAAMQPVWDQFAVDVGQDLIEAAQTFNQGE